MKTFVLLAMIFAGGEQTQFDTTFYDTMEQCQQRATRITESVADWRATGLDVRSETKCHEIKPETTSEE